MGASSMESVALSNEEGQLGWSMLVALAFTQEAEVRG